jgi:hypothetical protein
MRGRHVWHDLALTKIHAYYAEVLAEFSINDTAHMLQYLLKVIENSASTPRRRRPRPGPEQ